MSDVEIEAVGPINVRLGKNKARFDPRTLKLHNYTKSLAPPPAVANFGGKVREWPMYLNDSLGDCVCAAAGHMIEEWTIDAGQPFLPEDQQILQAYEQIGGYVPGEPDTDNGCDMLTALNTWRKNGIAGHKIAAFAVIEGSVVQSVNAVKVAEGVRRSVALFGNCYLGLQLPLSAQGQKEWAVPKEGESGDGTPGSWGGHCVPVVAYNATSLTVVTWGMTMDMQWGFLAAYCDEAYAVLSPDWIEKDGKSPSGFATGQLLEDLQSITS